MGLKELRKGFGVGSREPKSRQIITVLRWLVPVLCGPLLLLVVAAYYPFLIMDRTLYLVGGGSVCFFFSSVLPLSCTIPVCPNFPYSSGLSLAWAGLSGRPLSYGERSGL